MLARHVSDLIGPSSGAFCKSCIRRLWYVVLLCVLLDTSSRCKLCNGWTCRVVGVLPHTKVCKYIFYKTLLMMDRWGPKHVKLTSVLNKTYSLRPHCVSCWTTYILQDDTYTDPTMSSTVHSSLKYTNNWDDNFTFKLRPTAAFGTSHEQRRRIIQWAHPKWWGNSTYWTICPKQRDCNQQRWIATSLTKTNKATFFWHYFAYSSTTSKRRSVTYEPSFKHFSYIYNKF